MSNVEEYNFHLRNEYNVIDITRHIHPTALIDPRAILEKNVTIGPYTAIGPNVHIGKDTIVGAHVVIEGCTTIGNKNEISTGAIIGNKPQDLKYRGEESFVEIGNHNIIREYATINRGTKGGGGITIIGNNNLLMTSSHVAHDAVISNDCVIGHSSLIGGHVIIEKGATIAVLSGIHQFCRVGAYAMVGPGTMITKDVVPFTMVKGDPPRLRGLNKERLRRLDFSEKQKKGLKKAYNILFRSSLLKSEALIELQKLSHDINEIEILLDFFNCAKRGTYR